MLLQWQTWIVIIVVQVSLELSLMRIGNFFNGTNPLDTWHFDLMYFQNALISLLIMPLKMFWLTYSKSAFYELSLAFLFCKAYSWTICLFSWLVCIASFFLSIVLSIFFIYWMLFRDFVSVLGMLVFMLFWRCPKVSEPHLLVVFLCPLRVYVFCLYFAIL